MTPIRCTSWLATRVLRPCLRRRRVWQTVVSVNFVSSIDGAVTHKWQVRRTRRTGVTRPCSGCCVAVADVVLVRAHRLTEKLLEAATDLVFTSIRNHGEQALARARAVCHGRWTFRPTTRRPPTPDTMIHSARPHRPTADGPSPMRVPR